MEIINWIDKKYETIIREPQFKQYFHGYTPINMEGSNYLTNRALGIGLVMSEEFHITSIHLFSGKNMREKKFDGDIIYGLNFSMDRAQINKKFGIPQRHGGGMEVAPFGYFYCWDKYYFSHYSLHFKYVRDNSGIQLITIISLKIED